jgi:hypothetical protein
MRLAQIIMILTLLSTFALVWLEHATKLTH